MEIKHKKNRYIYNEFPRLNKNWMPIQQNNIEIKIGNNLPHIITIIQFHIHGLVVSCTIHHHAHGLTFECFVFD